MKVLLFLTPALVAVAAVVAFETPNRVQADFDHSDTVSQLSTQSAAPTETAEERVLRMLQGPPGEFVRLRVETDGSGSVLASTELEEPTVLVCGALGVGGTYDGPGTLFICGSTPAQAQYNAVGSMLSILTQGYACTACPFTNSCHLHAATLPGGWSLTTPIPVNTDNDGSTSCHGWVVRAIYKGAYTVYCTECEAN
jgi:hypothetical protein